MGTTTLKTRRARLASLMGIPANRTIPSHIQTEIDEILAKAFRYVYNYDRWEWLWDDERIELQAAYGEGSVAVTADGTAWTGTGTTWDTGWSGFMKMLAKGEVYNLTSIDSTTGITATDAALETLSGEDYHIYIDRVSLGANIVNFESLSVTFPSARIRYMPPAVMADHKSRGFLPGRPQFFGPAGYDTNGYPTIEFYPIPSNNEILHIQGYSAGTVPTADGGTDDIPDRFSDCVDERAKMLMYEYMGFAKQEYVMGYQLAKGRLMEAMRRMKDESQLEQGPQRVSLDPAVFGPRRLHYDVNLYET